MIKRNAHLDFPTPSGRCWKKPWNAKSNVFQVFGVETKVVNDELKWPIVAFGPKLSWLSYNGISFCISHFSSCTTIKKQLSYQDFERRERRGAQGNAIQM